jgi:hypothetical protein
MTGSSQIRPRELALLLLDSCDLPPRQRARDQQPDLAGLALKRRVLERLVAIDPDPDALEATLMRIVDEIGPPTGPTRAVALGIREEWEAACVTPDFMQHLIAEVAHHAR